MITFRAQSHFVTVTLCWLLAGPALAASSPPPTPKTVQSTLDCRRQTDREARLACYDAAVEALDRALDQGQVVAVDKVQAQAVRRQAFGFTLPSLTLFERGETPEQVAEVELAVESARRLPGGKWLLRLEGGQVWRQIDTGEFSRDPKPGSRAVIKRAALGSYMMMIGGRSPVRVHRDQ